MRRKRINNYFNLFPDYFFNLLDFNSLEDESVNFVDFDTHVKENEGTLSVTTGQNENGSWENREWVSVDGKTKMSSYVMKSNSKKTISEEDLRKQLKSAVEKEDYEEAVKIKKQIDSL